MKQKTVILTTLFFFPLFKSSGRCIAFITIMLNLLFSMLFIYLRSWLLSCLTELSSIINDDDDDGVDDDGGGGGGGGDDER